MKKIAIITGASSGIGAATARALARRGVDSILTFNKNEEGIRDLVNAIRASGNKAVALPLDVGRSETFPAFGATVAATLEGEWHAERVDYLVNNAGIGKMAPFAATSEAMFDELMRIILKGPYFLTQTMLPLLADGGAIVNVTSNSMMPAITEPGYSAYASMKGGLAVLTRYMAKELSKRGIRVNAVAPGATRTRIADDAFEKYPQVIEPIVKQTALNRLGEPDDIGSVIASLLSDDCRWVTAQNIDVSGGFRL